VAKIGVEAVPKRWSGKSKRTVAESGVGALKYASSRHTVHVRTESTYSANNAIGNDEYLG